METWVAEKMVHCNSKCSTVIQI